MGNPGRFTPLQPGAGGRGPGEMRIRAALPEDAEALAQLEHEREGVAVGVLLDRFTGRLQAGGAEGLLLLAAVEDQVVGWSRVVCFEPAAEAPAGQAPRGYYLSSLLVAPAWRRAGIGSALTRERLAWAAARAAEAYYFTNSRNRASIELHRRFGFEEVTREFWFPGVTFAGGQGILFRAALPAPEGRAPR